ncbi:MAG TPA: ankyrin repeat domain-containing protein [Vineibacter sp.]|nr:ankyrin repeat domain-containing protein [Vineibacter sp.]
MRREDRLLLSAAARGDAAEARRLVAAGASVSVTDESGGTPLHAATQGNHVEVARVLIEAGASVNKKNQEGDSAFLLASARGYLEIVRFALAKGADLSSVNRFGGTALIPAAHHGHVEVVRELLATRIAVDHVNRLGWTALLEAIILGDGGPRHTEIVRLLLAAGANPNVPDHDGVAALAHARRRQQTRIVDFLVAAGAR